jgi:hypothetical protein
MKKLTNRNPFNRKAQKMFIEAWKHLSKGMDLFEKAFLLQAITKRKEDKKCR